MTSLALKNLKKSFGPVEVIRDVDLTIEDGEFIVFVGPSGCGKSTLLRMIAGLEDITSGELVIDGRTMNDVPASKRGVAMVFQSYALYPHLTVRDNMGFGLKVRKVKPDEMRQRVDEAAATLKLDALMQRYPRELSGGQRQRVAIGRAIVGHPQVFLFDEPLSNLDAELRVHMRAEIASLHNRLSNTMIYVTHDQIEAMTLADRIVVLRDGRIEQVGTPRELYASPANVFVAQFIGSPKMNIFPASGLAANLSGQDFDLKAADQLGIRPEHLQIVPQGEGLLQGRVSVSEYTGAGSLLHIDVEGAGTFLVVQEGQVAADHGEPIGLSFSNENLHLFDAAGLAIQNL
uniref:ABC transporter ATP-binding protein n=1 Tax=Pararhizobium sp. IMCC3301 TaxID=3067904 RepID=UPI0027427FD8|nr:ABC transporter ATP-binding protein [Pararhizobium sp. IMCC3301]